MERVKQEAIASRGLGSRLSDEEKRRRVEEMKSEGRSHEQRKDERLAKVDAKEKEKEEMEAKWREQGDRTIFNKTQKAAYFNENTTLEERMRTQRHRRSKEVMDNLEKD